jgi:hypothetical protein
MLHNIPLVLLEYSNFSCRPNYTATPLPETNVTLTSYHNIYVYTRSILWTAYGVAIGVTFLGVLAGSLVYLLNHGSYSSKFSTILRVTRGATVSADLSMEDCNGLDPLPEHLVSARMATGHDPRHSTGFSPVATQEGLSTRKRALQMTASDHSRSGEVSE